MKYPKQIFLIRHGESIGNTLSCDEKVQIKDNTKDYPLTKKGREQVESLSKVMNKKFGDFDYVYTSFCRRTVETANILFKNNNIIEDARLGEAQRGVWHTMSEENIKLSFPYEKDRKEKEGLYYYRPLGGENWPDVEVRIHCFLESLYRNHAGHKIALIVHGHWLVLFQKIIDRMSINEAVSKYVNNVAENASVTIYEGGDTLKLVEDNLVLWDKLKIR